MEHHFTIGKASEQIKRWDRKVQTWVFDPPYNVGFKYDYGSDSLTEIKYRKLIHETAKAMIERTHEGGSCFLIHYTIPAARLIPTMESAGWKLHQWITWVYPHNMGMSKKKFTQGSRAVLWFVKGEQNMAHYDIKAVKGEYKNPTDKRIKKRIEAGHGPALMDWWHINLRKNVSKGHRGYSNQLPRELVKRLILTTTMDGDCVGDPMAGSGTTLEVCQEHRRQAYLNDINPKCEDMWRTLLKGDTSC